MGYWQNGAFFPGDRIIDEKDELTDKEFKAQCKRNLEKAYKEIDREEAFLKEIGYYDKDFKKRLR